MNTRTTQPTSVIEETWQLREQDMSYREIAAELGIPEGTVMSRLARARKIHKVTADHQARGTRKPYQRTEKSAMETARALRRHGTRLEIVDQNTILIVNV